MCVKPGDTLVATVWGWDDILDVLQPIDSILMPRIKYFAAQPWF